MIYLSGRCSPEFSHPRLGFLLPLRSWDKVPPDCLIAADNSCFANPQFYSEAKYLRFIDRLPRERTLFATAPDVLADHQKTVARSISVLRQIRNLGLPAAFVAQDGWTDDTTPWDEFDVLFIGGSTTFKFRRGRDAIAVAKKHAKKIHMGRVNSLDRLRGAVGLGCDTADGTYLKFGPDKNWPKLKGWLDHITMQVEMAV